MLALAAVALAVLGFAVPAIPPPLYLAAFVVAIGCMLAAEVLHLQALERHRTAARYPPVAFYRLTVTAWMRRTSRSLTPPLALGLVLVAAAVLWSFWLPTRPAVLMLVSAIALLLILTTVGQRWRR